jgi:hypothetical protein
MLTLRFASGVPPPDPSLGREVSTWRDDTGAVCARAFAAPGRRWVDWPSFGVYAFAPASRDVRVWASPSASLEDVTAIFERVLQPVILQALGWQTLHASAVLGSRGVLALCGQSGSGKSTIAYALREGGFAQFADDGLVIGQDDTAGVVAHALPFAPRLRPASFERFARGLQIPPGSPAAAGTPASAPLAGILLLQQDSAHRGPAAYARVEPTRAFTSLLTHAHCFDIDDPVATASLVDDYLALAGCVQVFALTYAPDLDRLEEVLRVVRRVADECGAGAPAVSSPA